MSADLEKKINTTYNSYLKNIAIRTDHMFGVIFILQWIVGILFAWFISPYAWRGDEAQIHFHVILAVFLGGANAAFPLYLILRHPGAKSTRYTIAIAQIIFSILLIHFTGGRIETHFHIFGSLAFLSFYKDRRVLVIATVITAADHVIRGIFWPESVYGVLTATPWRALEHAGWVIFEDIFLFVSIKNNLTQIRNVSEKKVHLEETLNPVEFKVEERTRELNESKKTIFEQQEHLTSVAKMSALGEMAAGIAHEINNPLATISVMTEQMKSAITEPEVDLKDLTRMLGTITKTTDRIAKIIYGMRSFTRNDANPPHQYTSLLKIIDETLILCQEKLKSQGVELQLETIPENILIDCRPIQISQVLINLLNNANDAIQKEDKKWIKISVDSSDGKVKIKVTDSGHGIEKEIRDKIFQPFYTTKEIGKGTGIGLSISRKIIENHHGTLTLNEQSPYTEFVITLPEKQEQTKKAS